MERLPSPSILPPTYTHSTTTVHAFTTSSTPTPTIHVPMDHPDLEKGECSGKTDSQGEIPQEKVDIEHTRVENDPRSWSRLKKVSPAVKLTGCVKVPVSHTRLQIFVLSLVSAASMIAGLGGSIYNRTYHTISSGYLIFTCSRSCNSGD